MLLSIVVWISVLDEEDLLLPPFQFEKSSVWRAKRNVDAITDISHFLTQDIDGDA